MNITINHSVAFRANEPQSIEWDYQKAVNNYQKRGRVVEVSHEASVNFDIELANRLKKLLTFRNFRKMK